MGIRKEHWIRVAGVILISLIIGGAIGWSGDQARAQSGTSSARAGAASPSFLQVGKRYSFRWDPGDNEVYKILEMRDGWARAERDRGNAAAEGVKPVVVWLNPTRAMTVTEVP
jgi:hypothetical protein